MRMMIPWGRDAEHRADLGRQNDLTKSQHHRLSCTISADSADFGNEDDPTTILLTPLESAPRTFLPPIAKSKSSSSPRIGSARWRARTCRSRWARRRVPEDGEQRVKRDVAASSPRSAEPDNLDGDF